MVTSENKLIWLIIMRRVVFCLGASLFFGGWATLFGGGDDGIVQIGAFILAFFVPLRELRIARDPATSTERII